MRLWSIYFIWESLNHKIWQTKKYLKELLLGFIIIYIEDNVDITLEIYCSYHKVMRKRRWLHKSYIDFFIDLYKIIFCGFKNINKKERNNAVCQ